MRVFENTPEKQPQNFYMGRETGELRPVYDDAGGEIGTEPVIAYDVQVRQDITAEGIYYTRRCAKGVRRIHLTPFSAELSCGVDEDNLLPVMTQIMIQEVSEDGGVTWTIPAVTERIVDADADGLIDFLLSTGPGSYCRIDTVDNYFLAGTGKQTYEISAPGKLTRLQLVVTIHDPMEAMIDLSDFDGPVEHVLSVNEAGEDVITYTFYPDGTEYAVIDPYLTVEEPASDIVVYCNSFSLKASISNGAVRMYDANGSASWIYSNTMVMYSVGAANYSFLYGEGEVTLLENTPTRVVIETTNIPGSSGSVLLPGVASHVVRYTIYPDSYFVSVTLVTDDIGFTQNNSNYNNQLAGVYLEGFTGVNGIYESGGVEVTGVNTNQPNASYVGVDTTTIGFMTSVLYSDAPYQQFIASATRTHVGWNAATFLPNSTYRFAAVVLSDFEGATNPTNRPVIGTQYHDILNNLNLPSVNIGTAITDLHLPDHIDEGICVDGAQHIDMNASDEAKVTINQSSINQALVLHDPSIKTGAVGSETEHLRLHWHCDSSTLDVYQTGDGSTITLSGSGMPDYQPARRGNGIQVDDAANEHVFFPCTDGNNINAAEGTIAFTYQNTAAPPDYAMFFFHDSGNTAFRLTRSSTNDSAIEFRANGGTSSLSIDPKLWDGSIHSVTFVWDFIALYAAVWIDCEFQDKTALTGTAPPLSAGNLVIGSRYDGSGYSGDLHCAGIIDNFKIYDAPILPYGSFIPGNLTDYSKAHSDITAHVLGDTLRIGGGTLSSIGTPASVTGQDGNSVSGRSYSDGNYDYFPADGLPTAKGFVSFWYKNESAIPLYARLFTTGGIYKVFHLEFQSNNTDEVNFLIGDVSGRIIVPGATLLDGNWHFISLFWDVQSDTRGVSINGGDVVLNTTPITTPDFTGLNFNVGNDPDSTSKSCNGIIYGLTITNSPNTPQVPFIPSHGPIHAPLMSKNGALARPGPDYQIAWVD